MAQDVIAVSGWVSREWIVYLPRYRPNLKSIKRLW